MKHETIILNLQLFAEAAAAPAATGADSAATGDNSASPVQTESESTAQSSPEQERQAAYQKLKTDYKAEYDAEVQSIIRDRLKKSSGEKDALSKKLSAAQPLFDMLSQKYGVESADDVEALFAAVEKDAGFWEAEASSKGVSVDQLKETKRLEREFARATRENEAYRQQERTNALYRQLTEEAEGLKDVYAGFDLKTETQNPTFMKLIGSGVDVRTAYEVAHKDDIIRGAMQFTAQKATEKVAASVAANGARPAENGLSQSAAATTGVDISKLTAKQLEEYKARARRGEKIDFRNNF